MFNKRKESVDHFKTNWDWWVIGILIVAALFIRSVNFHDWMHPNFDVARDATLLKKVHLEGPGELPLLGPKAGGTDLHLGPMFYYLEYLSVILFDSHSLTVLALPILFFSLATIPLFYYFLRQFFARPIAVLVTVIFSSSYAITQYSRFMWNPNMIPFWGILFLVAVYKTVQVKNKKIAGFWLLIVASAFGVLGQLHFLAFIGFSLIAIVFWFIFRPTKINWKFWAGSLLLLLFLYSPMIINDVKYKGNNFDHFIYSIKKKSENKERSLGEKIVKSTKEAGKFTMFFVVSTNDNEIKINDLLGIFFISCGLLVLLWQIKIHKRSSSRDKLAFLVLLLIWFLVFLILYTKAAYSLNKARFWLPVFPLVFIFLALIFLAIWKIKVRSISAGKFLVFFITVILLTANLSAIGKWYASLAVKDEVWSFRKWSSTSLRQRNLITLGEMEQVADHIVSQTKSGDLICLEGSRHERKTHAYLIIEKDSDRTVKLYDFEKHLFSKEELDACSSFFFVGDKHYSDEKLKEKLSRQLQLKSKYSTGVMEIYQLEYNKGEKEDVLQGESVVDVQTKKKNQNNNKKTEQVAPVRLPALFWKDLFSNSD